MSISVKIPSLGESITEAIIVKWHKKSGQAVAKDEPLCELETDKANVDVPSPAAGVISPVVAEGQTVAIGQEIATIDAASAEAPSASPAPAAPAAASQAPPPPVATASPAAQRIAGDAGIDPASVKGTGRGGRITKQDMQSAVAAAPTPAPKPLTAQSTPAVAPPAAAPSAPSPHPGDELGTPPRADD